MSVFSLVLSLVVIEAVRVQSYPGETYDEIPLSADELEYMTRRSASDPKQSETRRRSALDKNFVRFGRGDLSPLIGNDYNPHGLDVQWPEKGYNDAAPTSNNLFRDPTQLLTNQLFDQSNELDSSEEKLKRQPIHGDQYFRFGRKLPDDANSWSSIKRQFKGDQFFRLGRTVPNEFNTNKRSTDAKREPLRGDQYFRFGKRNEIDIDGMTPIKRNKIKGDQYWRFGKRDGDLEEAKRDPLRNDQYFRFGKSDSDVMTLDEDMIETKRNKMKGDQYFRFGRSVSTSETVPSKRHIRGDQYFRLGKSATRSSGASSEVKREPPFKGDAYFRLGKSDPDLKRKQMKGDQYFRFGKALKNKYKGRYRRDDYVGKNFARFGRKDKSMPTDTPLSHAGYRLV